MFAVAVAAGLPLLCLRRYAVTVTELSPVWIDWVVQVRESGETLAVQSDCLNPVFVVAVAVGLQLPRLHGVRWLLLECSGADRLSCVGA